MRFHEFTQWKAKENRIKNEFSFYRKIRHVSIHPNNGGKRDLFSLLMTTTSSQHRWWGLATFLYNLLPCLHLDPEFWGPFTGSIFPIFDEPLSSEGPRPHWDMALVGLHTMSQEDVTLGHSVTHRGCHHCHIRSPTKRLPSWSTGVPLGHPWLPGCLPLSYRWHR